MGNAKLEGSFGKDGSEEIRLRNEKQPKELEVALQCDCQRGNSSMSLLSVLDDKNRLIELLKRQIYNQKKQLGYYLGKGLSTSQINILSQTCIPAVIDDNIPLTLAMTNFCRHSGVKSRLMVVHDRMTNIDERVQSILVRQESLIAEVISKILTTRGNPDGDLKFSAHLSKIFVDSRTLNTFNTLLNATMDLGKELNMFRICCNRLILIEDERNALVEQVYSMPVEQRINCNQMIALQTEKRQLNKEMLRIRQEQDNLVEKLKCLRLFQQKIREMYENNDTTDDSLGELCQLLDTVKSDALSLLTITKEQKDKYDTDLAFLKQENESLKLKLEGDTKEKSKLAARVKSMENLRGSLEKQLMDKKIEVDDLAFGLQLITADRDTLQRAVEEMLEKLKEVESMRLDLEDLQGVRKERDNYKSQVEDLEAIRTAYSQLVDHCPDTGFQEERTELMKKIEVLESERVRLMKQIENANETAEMQDIQIKQLLIVIEKLGQHKEPQMFSKCNETDKTNGKTATTQSEIETRQTQYPFSNEMEVIHGQDSVTQKISEITVRDSSEPPQLYDYSVQDVRDEVNLKLRSEDDSPTNKLMSDAPLSQTSHFINSPPPSNKGTEVSLTTSDTNALTTSFEMQTTDKKGRKEYLKAVLESTSPVEGTLKMDRSNHLLLNLKCPKKKESYVTVKGTTLVGPSCHNLNIKATFPDNNYSDVSRNTSKLFLSGSCMALIKRLKKRDKLRTSAVSSTCNISLSETLRNEHYCRADLESLTSISLDGRPMYSSLNHPNGKGEFLQSINRKSNSRCSFLTNRIKMITSNLDGNLAKPEGKKCLVEAIQHMYNLYSDKK